MYNIVIVFALIGATSTASFALFNKNETEQESTETSKKFPRAIDSSVYVPLLNNQPPNNYPPNFPVYHPIYPGYANNVEYNKANNVYPMQSGYFAPSMPFVLPKYQEFPWTIMYSTLYLFSNLILFGVFNGYVLQFLLLPFVGVIFMTVICSFTSFCKITFPRLEMTKDKVRIANISKRFFTFNNKNHTHAHKNMISI